MCNGLEDRRIRILSQIRILSATQFAHPLVFVRDVYDGLKRHHVWRAFAREKTKSRYNRSVLGLLWIIASYAVFVAGISIFFGGFSSKPKPEFTIYVALGYAMFQFLVASISDGSAVLTTSSSWIKSTDLPYSINVFKSLFRSLVPFCMQLTLAFALMLAFGTLQQLSWHTLIILSALAVFILCAVPLQYSLGLIAARYSDVSHAISAITRLLIFVTPILWVGEEAKGMRGLLADFNPKTHFLEIFRNPLMSMEVRPLSWVVVLGLTMGLWIAAGFTRRLMRQRLPFWI